jgi:hypothetical protein
MSQGRENNDYNFIRLVFDNFLIYFSTGRMTDWRGIQKIMAELERFT